jgi:hypothetical protein
MRGLTVRELLDLLADCDQEWEVRICIYADDAREVRATGVEEAHASLWPSAVVISDMP